MGRKVSVWEWVVAVLLWIVKILIFTPVLGFIIIGLIAYGLLTHHYWLATYLLVFLPGAQWFCETLCP
ncbi:hypothetical protein [Vulcanisaeta sp. JCM 14467]|uniref:hypothetical protein n=1 Tax=Vulcanisaeta sp. JCM 14467 TaxID=1295370 RepID=UPI000A992D1E|nr:hypothetical protein [Vulcanisaeta sp. JCM 14467]